MYNYNKGGAIMDLARMSSNGQVVIPVEIRKLLNLKPKDKVLFIVKNGEVFIKNAEKIFEEKQGNTNE